MGYLAFLNAFGEKITLHKYYDYRDLRGRKLRICNYEYAISELAVDDNGHFLCDFYDKCAEMEELIEYELNEQQYLYLEWLRGTDSIVEEKQEEKPVVMIEPGIRSDILARAREYIMEGKEELVSDRYKEYIKRTESESMLILEKEL